jgi:lipoyl-dependent peroxiredoxin
MQVVAGGTKIALPADVGVDAEVDPRSCGLAYELAARLDVSLPGVERDAAERLIEATHQICSYSRATKGDIGTAIRLVRGGAAANPRRALVITPINQSAMPCLSYRYS